VTTDPQTIERINQLATTISQIAGQLQQIGLQLNQLGQPIQARPLASSENQSNLEERFSSLEDLVQQLTIRLGALERREVALTAPLLAVPAELAKSDLDSDTDDEPDEVLWDFIEPVVPSSESRSV